MRVFFDFKL